MSDSDDSSVIAEFMSGLETFVGFIEDIGVRFRLRISGRELVAVQLRDDEFVPSFKKVTFRGPCFTQDTLEDPCLYVQVNHSEENTTLFNKKLETVKGLKDDYLACLRSGAMAFGRPLTTATVGAFELIKKILKDPSWAREIDKVKYRPR